MQSFIRMIDHISDKEYQRRAWIKGEEADFDEAVCLFFELGDPVLENSDEFAITKTQYQLLKKFRDQFKLFSDKHNWPPEFIDSAEWGKITQMAKEVLVAFDYKKEYLENDPKFSWGDTLVVKKDAPQQFHPDSLVSVCSVEQAKTPDDAKKYHCAVNSWLYKVETLGTNAFIVPEHYLEPFVACHKACDAPNGSS